MPVVKIGPHRFDLNRIVRITESTKTQEGDGEPSITIKLECNDCVDIKGEDAYVFLAMYDEYVAVKVIGRAEQIVSEPNPPGRKISSPQSAEASPNHSGRIEESGVLS